MALNPVRRPLAASEKRLLQRKIGSFLAQSRRMSRIHLPLAAGVVFVLWVWTLLASDAPAVVATAFWFVVGAVLTFWVRHDMRRDARQVAAMAHSLESALRRNEADVYDIRASGFVEFEEIEDEGACYAFAIEGNRLVFVSGQEFYSEARFPSLDFSLVYVLDEQGRAVDMVLEKRGEKARPMRAIPRSMKSQLDLPDHLDVRTGRLDDVEDLLRRGV